ncbi:hypothetical protein C8J57DRAFT_1244719 [Mycena rebaudengoi]|nr:hypothetical protein C8J57DRAFT_1244719 [Mycena rebaudengoi]
MPASPQQLPSSKHTACRTEYYGGGPPAGAAGGGCVYVVISLDYHRDLDTIAALRAQIAVLKTGETQMKVGEALMKAEIVRLEGENSALRGEGRRVVGEKRKAAGMLSVDDVEGSSVTKKARVHNLSWEAIYSPHFAERECPRFFEQWDKIA